MKLSSDAYLNGFYYKPRMDKSTLADWSDGLVAINGHLGSSVAFHLAAVVRTNDQGHWDLAVAEATWHAETFAPGEDGEPRFYIELQRHVPEQERINPLLKKLAAELDLPLVIDNDAHFLNAEDHDDHDTLCCISMGKTKDDPDRLRYPEQLYVKNAEEMKTLFPEADEQEGLRNTVRIADRCNVDLSEGENHAPVVEVVHPGEPPRYDGGDLTELTADRPVLPEVGAKVQTQPTDSAEWSPVAVVLKVGDEKTDKVGQLKIAGTTGSNAFLVPHWAPMQLPLMRRAPVTPKKDAKDGSLGVSVDDYAGCANLEAAKSLDVDLDVEASLSGYQWAGVHTTVKAEHLCLKGRNPGYSLVPFNCFSRKKFDAL